LEALEKLKSQRGTVQSDVFMESDGNICKIKLKEALEAIGGDYQSAVVRNKDSEESLKTFKRQNEMKKARLKKIEIEDLIWIEKIGEGQFGQVHLVKHPDHQAPFAIKTISKYQIYLDGLVQYALVR
jgi:cGMP-dependent protein kinase 1